MVRCKDYIGVEIDSRMSLISYDEWTMLRVRLVVRSPQHNQELDHPYK